MDPMTKKIILNLSEEHDRLAVQVAALMAITGAMLEKQRPDESRLIAWCAAISDVSDDQSQTAIQKMALSLLKGLEAAKSRKQT